ncbi:hypothetical protein F4604DRAFT_2016478 [Suillus subluteus]|nr:hypothetical protein F4604DRAFT_2016478 [Suillus subluteus]
MLAECMGPIVVYDQSSALEHAGVPFVLRGMQSSTPLQLICDSEAQSLRSNNKGLSNWVARLCYEDRVLAWTYQEPSGQIITSGISRSQLGIAALEFSELLQVLAGLLSDINDGFNPAAEPQPEPSQFASGTAAVTLPLTEKLSPSVVIADFESLPLTLSVESPAKQHILHNFWVKNMDIELAEVS